MSARGSHWQAADDQVARRRSGTQLAPALVEVFCREAPQVFDGLASSTSGDSVIAAEPASGVRL